MKHTVNVLGVALTAVVFFLFMVFVEENYVLNEIVIPRSDFTVEEWLGSFHRWGTIGICAAAIASLAWYVLGQWVFKVNDWTKAGKRPIWYLLFLIPVLASAAGIVFTTQAQDKAWVAFAFYLLNGVLSYYLATALFSASSFKYTPVGASSLRRWNFKF